MLFDRVPLKWFFDAADAGVLSVFVVFSTWEAIQKLRGR